MNDHDLTIRAARPDDTRALARLAQLDSTLPLTGGVLLAELEGASIAAISLETGAVIADPFQPTAGTVRALTFRRHQLTRPDGRRPLRSTMRRIRAAASGSA